MAPLEMGVGEIEVCKGCIELVEGGMGKGRYPHVELYLQIDVVCAPILLCGIYTGEGGLCGEGGCYSCVI